MQPNLARGLVVPFEQCHDSDFASDAAATLHHHTALFRDVHVASLAADVGFVSFDGAVHPAASIALQGETEPREHEPRSFLSDAQCAGQFVAADTILAA